MKHVPFPLRVAAGLAATTAERARTLPRQLVELPVTVVSEVLQVSMRVQQHVTELAIKGDDVLASFRRPEETPEWATFDEDIDDRDDGSAPTSPDVAPSNNGSFASPDPWAAEERALAEEYPDGEFDSPGVTTGPSVTTSPGGLTNYDELTLPQVRARLRSLTTEQLEELLAYERAHADRPSFTGMLTRRIANVRRSEGPDAGE